jgi:hypothetical protein
VRSETRGSLERHLPQPTPTEQDLFAMRRAAWRRQGIVVLRPVDVRDEIIRQALVNEATRLYGQREIASLRGANGIPGPA